MDFTADITPARTIDGATLIIANVMEELGLKADNYATATRRDGSVSVVGLSVDSDNMLVMNEDKIWEATAKAGSAFILDFVHGFPILSNRNG